MSEQQELAATYREYFPKIVKFMAYRVGPSEAEDLASEVFLRIVRHLHCQRGSEKAWIYRIARNVAIDFLKSARTRREVTCDPQDQQQLPNAQVGAPPHGIRIDIQRALGKLTDEQREMITQKFLLGLDNGEIAEITGRKPAAIRALQFRALKALRAILDEGGNGTCART